MEAYDVTLLFFFNILLSKKEIGTRFSLTIWNCNKCLTKPSLMAYDEVAEWLRRWTANPLGSARVGSNPIFVDIFFNAYSKFYKINMFTYVVMFFNSIINIIYNKNNVSLAVVVRDTQLNFFLPWPGFEPGLSRPQREVLTTIRSRPARSLKNEDFEWTIS